MSLCGQLQPLCTCQCGGLVVQKTALPRPPPTLRLFCDVPPDIVGVGADIDAPFPVKTQHSLTPSQPCLPLKGTSLPEAPNKQRELWPCLFPPETGHCSHSSTWFTLLSLEPISQRTYPIFLVSCQPFSEEWFLTPSVPPGVLRHTQPWVIFWLVPPRLGSCAPPHSNGCFVASVCT